MSRQDIEPHEAVRVKPRRIDAPHSVGSPPAEPSRAEQPELAATTGRSVVLRRVQPLEKAVDSKSLAAARANPTSTEVKTALSTEQADEQSAWAASLAEREEQLEHQSAQLAGQLQEQLREVEQREAQQNVRAAELDNEFRQARLWAEEQLAELRRREEAVNEAEARQTGLLLRVEELEERDRAVQAKEAGIASRVEQLEIEEANIRQRRQSIEQEAIALHRARVEWERSREEDRAELTNERSAYREELSAEWCGRQEALAKAENLLAKQLREWEQDSQTLARERADWQRQQTADREAISLLRNRTEAELEQRRSRLTSRETALDQQQAALDQLRSEITTAHRQSIEMRLMAEQLWAQVQGRMPPAEITQSIAQLRLKLAEQYRLEQHGLREQQEELLRLAEKVAQESGVLRTQRQELQSWFAAREQEIERHAKSLVERERELMEQSDQLRAIETGWNTDRRQLELELREMHSLLRQAAA